MPATHVIANRQEHPRILILDDGKGFPERVQQDVEFSCTLKVVSSLEQVDPSEWDALITNRRHMVSTFNNFDFIHNRVAEHLYIFSVLPGGWNANPGRLDRVKGADQRDDWVNLELRGHVPGNEVRVNTGLDPDLRASLVAAVEARSHQVGLLVPESLPKGVILDEFARGPQDLVLAGALQAPGRGEVWFVPTEVDSLRPWLFAAMQSWRRQDPKKFPGDPDWWESLEWFSAHERTIAKKIEVEVAAFEHAKAQFLSTLEGLEAALSDAREQASVGSRQLLVGQGDPLQDSVRDALRDLGFGVRDMDLEWPENERREDFRITDPSDPTWLVLGDATGVQGNAKGGKTAALQSYVTKYVYEEKPGRIPGMWYLLNREISKDPAARSTILRSDEVAPFASENGLILDTTALYVLLRHGEEIPADKGAIREYLRTSVGRLSLQDAQAWLQGRKGIVSVPS
ncbi:hypothetical protein [Arthrobacter sp. RAF14]|uniref:hypothetical protein n=1 Tax=Arthrobacter sp. RAF14 TaxID=3233051 RepID=UPI003F91AF1C